MIDKKIITADGINLLWEIMKTCPATPFNGGEKARKHLHKLCKNGKDVSGATLRAGVEKAVFCEYVDEMDVYSHLLANTQSDKIGRLEVMRYFGGDIHADKIFKSAIKDGFPNNYALKIVFGHLLVPIVVDDVKLGCAVDNSGILIENLLVFSDDKRSYFQSELAMMHYGFIVGKISREELEALNLINQKSPIFLEAIEILQGKMDFSAMHYFPRSLAMAKK